MAALKLIWIIAGCACGIALILLGIFGILVMIGIFLKALK